MIKDFIERIDKKKLEIKKNHHYVWADYLRRWSSDGVQVHYTTRKTRIIGFDSVRNIAVKRSFYRSRPITNKHLYIIKNWSSMSPSYLQGYHMKYLEHFIRMQNLEDLCRKDDNYTEHIANFFESWRSNSIEKLYTFHENEVKGTLDALAKRDFSVLDNAEKMRSFMLFLGQQTARTENFKETASASIGIIIFFPTNLINKSPIIL